MSHSLFAALAVNFRFTRSSCTAGPGLFRRPRFLPNRLKIFWLEHSRATRFSDAVRPSAGSSSAIRRYPNSGSSRCTSRAAVINAALVPVPLRDRVFQPFVERLLGELQHPAGHRHPDGCSLRGEVTDQRVHHFGRVSRVR